MTNEEMRVEIAKELGLDNRWVIMKHGLYYRPGAHGYTNNIQEAWVVSEAEADRHVYPHDDPVTKHPAPLPDWPNDLNSCHEMEKHITIEQSGEYDAILDDLLNVDVEHGDGVIITPIWHAPAPQRCTAFLKTVGRWKE